MLTSTDFRGLLNQRFFNNLLPVPATNQFRLGTLAPPFQLANAHTSQPVRLSDYLRSAEAGSVPSRAVVLAFTRIFTERQYCPLCFPHIVALNQAYEQFQSCQVEVLMITSTTLAQSRTIIQDLGLKLPLLTDPACRVFRSYQVGQALGAPLPAQFIIDPTGKIRFRHLFSFLQPNASVETLLAEAERIAA